MIKKKKKNQCCNESPAHLKPQFCHCSSPGGNLKFHPYSTCKHTHSHTSSFCTSVWEQLFSAPHISHRNVSMWASCAGCLCLIHTDFMHEVKDKDKMWRCKKPPHLSLFLYMKPSTLAKTGFLTQFETPRRSLVGIWLKEILKGPVWKNTGGQRWLNSHPGLNPQTHPCKCSRPRWMRLGATWCGGGWICDKPDLVRLVVPGKRALWNNPELGITLSLKHLDTITNSPFSTRYQHICPSYESRLGL